MKGKQRRGKRREERGGKNDRKDKQEKEEGTGRAEKEDTARESRHQPAQGPVPLTHENPQVVIWGECISTCTTSLALSLPHLSSRPPSSAGLYHVSHSGGSL